MGSVKEDESYVPRGYRGSRRSLTASYVSSGMYVHRMHTYVRAYHPHQFCCAALNATCKQVHSFTLYDRIIRLDDMQEQLCGTKLCKLFNQ
jgi:hypothetical protein